jgi:hypothetical protein
MSLEIVTEARGASAVMIAAASCSMLVFTGEKTEETATAVIPLSLSSAATRFTSSTSSGEISRPSNSCPPWQR